MFKRKIKSQTDIHKKADCYFKGLVERQGLVTEHRAIFIEVQMEKQVRENQWRQRLEAEALLTVIAMNAFPQVDLQSRERLKNGN